MMSNHTQRQKLAAWLEAWRLDQTLAAVDDAMPDTQDARTAVSCPVAKTMAGERYRETPTAPPRTGDILLLKPLTPLTARRPVYVLVLGLGEARGTRRVAPFARFDVPATPEEVITGLPPPPLRVLALWNQRVVPMVRLAALAWSVRRLSRAQRLAALASDDRRRGPPLVHPLDPRHAYLDEERLLWPEWETITVGEGWGGGRVAERTTADTWELAQAAEKADDAYGTKR